MTRFFDGPAEGTRLSLSRAPHYLRAVRNAAGVWDALDQLDDTPRADETIVAYELAGGEPTRIHVQRVVDGRRRCSWETHAIYTVVAVQPPDAVLRDTARWRSWVAEQIGRPLNPDGSAAEGGTE